MTNPPEACEHCSRQERNRQLVATRNAEKAASRAQDAADLASGKKTREQLRRENSHFRELAQAPILWDKIKRLS
jgi:hypothetical protein